MNTIVANLDGPRNYWPACLSETRMINRFQKERLTSFIYQNINDENQRELKLSELDDLTEIDADYALYQFSRGIWS